PPAAPAAPGAAPILAPPEEAEAGPPPSAGASGPAPSAAPVKPPPPRHTLYTAAVIQVLDKVTAESLRFEAPLHRFIRYKGLIFRVDTCQSSEDPDQPSAA